MTAGQRRQQGTGQQSANGKWETGYRRVSGGRSVDVGGSSDYQAWMRSPGDTPPFQRVWRLVRRIPRGKVATYGQLSQLIDRRLTPVGVGWAIRAAPEGSIPWQRVVNASGGISTDREHPGLQRAMLEAEGVRFDGEGCVDLARYAWRPRAR